MKTWFVLAALLLPVAVPVEAGAKRKDCSCAVRRVIGCPCAGSSFRSFRTPAFAHYAAPAPTTRMVVLSRCRKEKIYREPCGTWNPHVVTELLVREYRFDGSFRDFLVEQ